MAPETVWGMHPGETGDAHGLFTEKRVVAIGWPDMGDLSALKTWDDFKARYEQVFPGKKPSHIAVNAGQIYRFVHEVKVGDLVHVGRKEHRV